MATRQINVMIVEDEKFVRKLVCCVLEKEKHVKISVVAETDNGTEAVKLAGIHKPDVVIMDINIRGINGIDATRQILDDNPAIKVIAVSILSSKTAIIEMLRSGAMGFIPKDDSYEELLKAISAVIEGKYYFSHRLTPVMRNYFVNSLDASGNSLLSLSDDDMALVRLSIEGQSLKDIAGLLGASVNCISKRRERIFNKLGVDSISDLVNLSVREGLIRTARSN